MAANTSPVFALTPLINVGAPITTANTAKDGTGTVKLIYTAGAAGGYIQKIRFHSCGTNTASVARVFINNGADPTTAANNILYADISLPATTNSEIAQILTAEVELTMGFAIPATYRIYWTIGTTVAAGWQGICVAGDY